MKKIISILAAAALMLTMAACLPVVPNNNEGSNIQNSESDAVPESSAADTSLIKDGYIDLMSTENLSHRELELVDVCWLDASRLIIAAELEEDNSDKELLRIVIVNIDNGEDSLLWEGENDMEDEHDTIATDGEYVYYRCKMVTTKRIRISDGAAETATDIESGKGFGQNIPYLGKSIVTKEVEGDDNYQLFYDDVFAGERHELATENITGPINTYKKNREAEGTPYTANPIREWSPNGEYILFGYKILQGPRGYYTSVGEQCAVYDLNGTMLYRSAHDQNINVEHFWSADSNNLCHLLSSKKDGSEIYTIVKHDISANSTAEYDAAFLPDPSLFPRLVFSAASEFCVFVQQNADESRSFCRYDLGGEVTELCRLPDAFGYDYVTAEISPDDARIVYRLSEDDSMLVCIADVK